MYRCIGFMWQDFGSRGAASEVCVGRDWDCPVLDTDAASWLQQSHHSTLLSPSAKLMVPLWKDI